MPLLDEKETDEWRASLQSLTTSLTEIKTTLAALPDHSPKVTALEAQITKLETEIAELRKTPPTPTPPPSPPKPGDPADPNSPPKKKTPEPAPAPEVRRRSKPAFL